MRRVLVAAILAVVGASARLSSATVTSPPVAVETECPVCSQRFTYISDGWDIGPNPRTCPWCLYTSTASYFDSVDPQDAGPIRDALSYAATKLPALCKEVYGVELSDLLEEQWSDYYLTDLLVVFCCGPRRDLPPDCIEVVDAIGSYFPNETIAKYCRHRRWQVYELHKNEPARSPLSDEADRRMQPGHQMASTDSRQISRTVQLACLRVENGAVEEGLSLVPVVRAQVDAWQQAYGRLDDDWADSVARIPTNLEKRIDALRIGEWSIERLHEDANQYVNDGSFPSTPQYAALTALEELKRRGDPEEIEFIVQWAMQSPERFEDAVSRDIIDHGMIISDHRLLDYVRTLPMVPSRADGVPEYNAAGMRLQRRQVVAPYLDDELLRTCQTPQEILRVLEQRSLRDALAAPLYQTGMITEDDVDAGHAYGFVHHELVGLLGNDGRLDPSAVGKEVRVPRIPDWYAIEQYPSGAMWTGLGRLIEEQGSPEALATALRWIPTLTESHVQYIYSGGYWLGSLIRAVHKRPELWDAVLTNDLQPVNRTQEVIGASVRAAAGDATAHEALLALVGARSDSEVNTGIAVVALGIIGDRSILPTMLTALRDSDKLMQPAADYYLSWVAGPADLPALEETARAIRRANVGLPKNETWGRLFTLNSLESIVLNVRMKQLRDSLSQ